MSTFPTANTFQFKMKYSLVLISVVACALGAKFPPNFKKCKRSDPDAQKCYLEAAQNGISQLTKPFPEINLANFSPMDILELKIGAGSQAVVNVAQNFRNCKLYGIEKTKLETFRIDFEKKYVTATGFIPEIKKLCDYEVNGKVLLLPVVGNGKSTIILRDIKVTPRFDFEEVKRKGKTYLKFVTHKFGIEPDFISYNFENLFNGDKQLGDSINKVLNDNYKEVFLDVKAGYEDGLGQVIQQILNNLFQKVSVEEAFD